MSLSSTNERQIKARQQQQLRDRITDEVITKMLMSTADGRRWVWLRLSEARLFQSDESFEPMRMAYDKGLRNAGLRLLDDVQKFCPTEYISMTNEAQLAEAKITKKDPNYVGTEQLYAQLAASGTDDDSGDRGDALPLWDRLG